MEALNSNTLVIAELVIIVAMAAYMIYIRVAAVKAGVSTDDVQTDEVLLTIVSAFLYVEKSLSDKNGDEKIAYVVDMVFNAMNGEANGLSKEYIETLVRQAYAAYKTNEQVIFKPYNSNVLSKIVTDSVVKAVTDA